MKEIEPYDDVVYTVEYDVQWRMYHVHKTTIRGGVGETETVALTEEEYRNLFD